MQPPARGAVVFAVVVAVVGVAVGCGRRTGIHARCCHFLGCLNRLFKNCWLCDEPLLFLSVFDETELCEECEEINIRPVHPLTEVRHSQAYAQCTSR